MPPTELTRRQAMGAAALGAFGLLAAPALLISCTAPAGLLPMVRKELKNPLSKLAGAAGRIDGPLTAKIAEVDIGVGRMVRTYTYDGMLPGPTWDLRPGQTIAVELRNELPRVGEHGETAHLDPATAVTADGSEIDFAMTRPHGWTNTNFHTHGLHVSPSDTEEGGRRDHHPRRDRRGPRGQGGRGATPRPPGHRTLEGLRASGPHAERPERQLLA